MRLWRCFAIVSIGAITLAGCTPAATAPMSAQTTDFGHVHGLGVDPASGDLFVATHRGVWRLASGYLGRKSSSVAPEQVGGRSQDTMSFTIAGPGLMFASGHPDPANNPDQSPPNLGLIESRDGASSWKTVSLTGETDFHDLVTTPLKGGGSPLRVYGYDASRQTIMSSDNSGITWQDRSAIALRKLAVNTSDPGVVYATTPSGLQVSRDAGLTFTAVPKAPQLLLIDAVNTNPGSFVGADVNGVIWSTDDSASTWQRRGNLDSPPEAMTYVADAEKAWILASDNRGIVASLDYGKNWITLIPDGSR
jgi:hypothetical protein